MFDRVPSQVLSCQTSNYRFDNKRQITYNGYPIEQLTDNQQTTRIDSTRTINDQKEYRNIKIMYNGYIKVIKKDFMSRFNKLTINELNFFCILFKSNDHLINYINDFFQKSGNTRNFQCC
jgi:hypothetical protein